MKLSFKVLLKYLALLSFMIVFSSASNLSYEFPPTYESLSKSHGESELSPRDIPVNPYKYAEKFKTGFILLHGPHDPFKAFELLDLAIKERLSFEIDGNVVKLGDKTYFVNAHDPIMYWYNCQKFPAEDNPEAINVYRYIEKLKGHIVPVKFDFKSPKAIEPLIEASLKLPPELRIGHAFIKELVYPGTKLKPWQYGELLTLEQVLYAKKAMGNIPFHVSCKGVTRDKLTESYLDRIGKLLSGKVEVISFCLPNHSAPPAHVLDYLWNKYHLMVEIWIDHPEQKLFWLSYSMSHKVPFIGLTDDPRLATRVGSTPREDYERAYNLTISQP